MRLDKRLTTAAACACLAVAAGHFMQSGTEASGVAAATNALNASAGMVRSTRVSSREVDALLAGADGPDSLRGAFPREPEPAPALAPVGRGVVRRHSLPPDTFHGYNQTPRAGLSAFGLRCDRTLAAAAMPDALVRLTLSASCIPNQRVEIEHEGLRFAERTSSTGVLELVVPALAEIAEFRVTFGDGESLAARAEVVEAKRNDRVALQWIGKRALSIHAFEYEASYGDPVHRRPSRTDKALRHTGRGVGTIYEFGDPDVDDPVMMQVYDFSTGGAWPDGFDGFHIEAKVTAANCGTELSAVAAQTIPGKRVKLVDVLVAMPGCDAVGDILILKNVLRDQRIASN